jgi:hypothetical protein
MNGIAATLALQILRDDGADTIADELEAEWRALVGERDRARDVACRYGELLWQAQTDGPCDVIVGKR